MVVALWTRNPLSDYTSPQPTIYLLHLPTVPQSSLDHQDRRFSLYFLVKEVPLHWPSATTGGGPHGRLLLPIATTPHHSLE